MVPISSRQTHTLLPFVCFSLKVATTPYVDAYRAQDDDDGDSGVWGVVVLFCCSSNVRCCLYLLSSNNLCLWWFHSHLCMFNCHCCWNDDVAFVNVSSCIWCKMFAKLNEKHIQPDTHTNTAITHIDFQEKQFILKSTLIFIRYYTTPIHLRSTAGYMDL